MRHYRVLLLGNDTTLATHTRIAEILHAEEEIKIECCTTNQNTGSSTDLANRIESLLEEYKPDAVHFSAGQVDARWVPAEKRNVVPIAEYEQHLQNIIDTCKSRLGGDIVFATATPVIDEKQTPAPAAPALTNNEAQPYDLFNREIEQYNIAAQQVMLANDVLINHLDRVIQERNDEYLAADGVSLTPAGIECAAVHTANCIRQLWH